ncbi:MAG: hypothetical protein ABW006_02590 [Hyphomicrobium sp.]
MVGARTAYGFQQCGTVGSVNVVPNWHDRACNAARPAQKVSADMNGSDREQTIILAAFAGLVAYVLTAGLKLAVGALF